MLLLKEHTASLRNGRRLKDEAPPGGPTGSLRGRSYACGMGYAHKGEVFVATTGLATLCGPGGLRVTPHHAPTD
jgi:hypothetical protein